MLFLFRETVLDRLGQLVIVFLVVVGRIKVEVEPGTVQPEC